MRGKVFDCLQPSLEGPLPGFEDTKDGVSIKEVSGTDLCLTWSKSEPLEWIFEISAKSACMLRSVVLLDSTLSSFALQELWSVDGERRRKALGGNGARTASEGEGVLLLHRIGTRDKIQVKVVFKPCSGVLGQLVVFDFGSFFLVRSVLVQSCSQEEADLLESSSSELLLDSQETDRPAKPDLFWDQHYEKVSLPRAMFEEEVDSKLKEYPLREKVEQLIEEGKYDNVEKEVKEVNYKRRMSSLLYLEEYQQRKNISRYDLYGIKITPERKVTNMETGLTVAPAGFYYVTVKLNECLSERGRSMNKNDGALILPRSQHTVYECLVDNVGKDYVILLVPESAIEACKASEYRCSMRFFLGRIPMRAMQHAIEKLNISVIFPTPREQSPLQNVSVEVRKCFEEVKKTELNSIQQAAIYSMLDPACTQIPSLVLGPFGCGKTRTLYECVKLLALHVRGARILVCTHSNSAANIYVNKLDKDWAGNAPLFRLFYTKRHYIDTRIRQYCNMRNNSPTVPSLEELRQYKIVVTTLTTAKTLSLLDVPQGFFTHIFIDEAAQAFEAETLIPLSLASEYTKITLAGDHMQLDPPVSSPLALRYGLQLSLLERLFDHDAYKKGVGQLCKTLLTENYRSHPEILALPSQLFYEEKLIPRARFPPNGPKDFPAVKFVGVAGQEARDSDSPSFYNHQEALQIAVEVELMIRNGIQPTEICVLSYYHKQVNCMRQVLRRKKLGKVSVHSVDNVQGEEYRVLLLSTVRTCSTDPNPEEDTGFLTNPKLFNTAITRAGEWLIVVGEPVTLCTIGLNRMCWMEYIRRCNRLGSFKYQNTEHFENLLENKLIIRQVLEKTFKLFFRKFSPTGQLPTANYPEALPNSYSQVLPPGEFSRMDPNAQKKILSAKVAAAVVSKDESTISRITDELRTLSVEQQEQLLNRADFFTTKVKEMESILRRAAAPASSSSNPLPSSSAPLMAKSTPGPSSIPGERYSLYNAQQGQHHPNPPQPPSHSAPLPPPSSSSSSSSSAQHTNTTATAKPFFPTGTGPLTSQHIPPSSSSSTFPSNSTTAPVVSSANPSSEVSKLGPPPNLPVLPQQQQRQQQQQQPQQFPQLPPPTQFYAGSGGPQPYPSPSPSHSGASGPPTGTLHGSQMGVAYPGLRGYPSYPSGQIDLPPFLTFMIDALTKHLKFCDHQLQNNPKLVPEARENLNRQKGNLSEQMKLVNNQITLYREFVHIYRASSQPVAMTTAGSNTGSDVGGRSGLSNGPIQGDGRQPSYPISYGAGNRGGGVGRVSLAQQHQDRLSQQMASGSSHIMGGRGGRGGEPPNRTATVAGAAMAPTGPAGTNAPPLSPQSNQDEVYFSGDEFN